MSERVPECFYGGYYGYGGSLSAPVIGMRPLAEQQKEKESMSSKVKVKVERTKLITLLEERLTTVGDEPLHPAALKLIEALERATEHIRSGGRAENDVGYATGLIQKVYNAADELGKYERAERGENREKIRDKINRQLKLLNLSDDEHVDVGIEDEIYELL